MFSNLKIIKIIILIVFFINPNVVIANDVEKFANKLFNHYEYDDKIYKYLKSVFSFGSSKSNKSYVAKTNFSKTNNQSSTHKLKVKSKNKIVYFFGDGQSLQINPSNIDDKIIYNKTPFSYFEFKRDSVLYGFSIDF